MYILSLLNTLSRKLDEVMDLLTKIKNEPDSPVMNEEFVCEVLIEQYLQFNEEAAAEESMLSPVTSITCADFELSTGSDSATFEIGDEERLKSFSVDCFLLIAPPENELKSVVDAAFPPELEHTSPITLGDLEEPDNRSLHGLHEVKRDGRASRINRSDVSTGIVEILNRLDIGTSYESINPETGRSSQASFLSSKTKKRSFFKRLSSAFTTKNK
jgi:hypothetical protein